MRFDKTVANVLSRFRYHHLSNATHLYIGVGFVAFLGFPLLVISGHMWFPKYIQLIDVKINIIGGILGFGLMTCTFWPERIKPLLPWFWLMSLIYIFPFFFTYLFLISKANDLASMALLSSVFLMVLLTDLVILTLSLVSGIALAFLVYMIQNPHVYLNQEHFEVVMVGLFFMVAATFVKHRNKVLHEQRMQGIAAVAGMIAHELRTPLLGIKSGAKALDSKLPDILKGYSLAEKKGLIESAVSTRKIEQLQLVNQRIISETNYANTIIDMLLLKAGRENSLGQSELVNCSMGDVLAKAIHRYPFRTRQEKKLVSWQGDFTFLGSQLLMTHVIFNLLKNALYVIKKQGRGDVTIWTSSHDSGHCLYFKDTAGAMSAKQLRRLFEHFYSTTFMGTGIGLSYCKMVMEQIGGQIECEVEEQKYTLFKLKFPHVSAEENVKID